MIDLHELFDDGSFHITIPTYFVRREASLTDCGAVLPELIKWSNNLGSHPIAFTDLDLFERYLARTGDSSLKPIALRDLAAFETFLRLLAQLGETAIAYDLFENKAHIVPIAATLKETRRLLDEQKPS
jgi:hypothetical protein